MSSYSTTIDEDTHNWLKNYFKVDVAQIQAEHPELDYTDWYTYS